MIKLETFQGHIVLYCKTHYKFKDFFDGLKRIWAIRCGYDYEHTSSDVMRYIANDMYSIIALTQPKKLEHLMQIIHHEVTNQAFYKPQNMTPIEAIVWEYRSVLCNLQIKDGNKTLVYLPKPQRRIFNRILNGNGHFSDYDLIINKDNVLTETM